ncbi:MAG: prolyl oligopeptidase family serine peptidase [Deltaproteobacteria bacterium]|nr:prolyl oligopeptidase family serine peptidase [Deltaproteobacteria bacterium]
MKSREFLVALAVVFTCLGCSSSDGPDGPQNALPFAPAGPQAAPDPALAGPFPVGLMTVEVLDETRIHEQTGKPRRLILEIWYPAEQRYKDGPWAVYDLAAEAPEEYLGDKYEIVHDAELPVIETASVRDAAMDREHAPYPLLFFSHGANGIRWQSIFYTIHLASHGYVVVSPDHEYNTLWDIIRDGYDPGSVALSAPQRIEDLRLLADLFIDKNDTPDDFFEASIDPERIGITGHSFGGWTTLCKLCQDERFKVGVAHAPEIPMAIGYCDFNAYPAPIMVMGGTLDDTLDWRDQYCGYQAMQTSLPKFLVELVDAGHFTFSDICRLDLLSIAEDLGMGGQAEDALKDGCGEFNMPWEQAHDVIRYYATAFFNQHLRDSPGSESFLVDLAEAPYDQVNFYRGQAPDWPDGGC